MPNFNLKVSTTCPRCNQTRQARGDVVRKAEREGKKLYCKPCRNQERFEKKSHPTKGTGVKSDSEKLYTRTSYYRAKQRCRMGKRHHPAYENVEFKFESLDQLIGLIGLRPKGCTIDRINTLGHYEPGNVRWATVAEQAKNRMPKNYWNRQKLSGKGD